MNTVTTWMDYTLPDNIQNLYVSGDGLYAAGNSLDNLIVVDDGDAMQLYGAGGNNVLVGGAGTDTFVIDGGAGSNAIYNWHAGDQLRLLGGSFTSFAQVQAAMTQQGADVVLHNGQNDVVIRNATVAQFQASDFQLALDHAKLGAATFDDEFDALSLYDGKSGTWTPHYWYGGQGAYTLPGNGELQIYTAPGFTGAGTADLGLNPFSIANGVLDIHAQTVTSAQSAAMWNYQYSSGVLTTHDTFAQTYGYFEMRAELPTDVSGAWPAFWLVPADGSWPPELDVMETLSGASSIDYTTVHSGASGAHTAVGAANLVTNVGGYHTYGVLWTATDLTWFLDGQAVFHTATPADMNKPMYMIVNLAVGGWAGAPDFTAADMQIDYIRAYALADGSSTWTSSVTPDAPHATDPTDPVDPTDGSTPGSPSTPTDGSSTTPGGSSSTGTDESSTTPTDGSSHAGGSGAGASAVSVADASYTAPEGVSTITLAGSWQTVHGNDAGDTFVVANNTGNALYGGAGNDTFYMGRGGDWVVGGGGADTFVFTELPWVAAHILDFDPAHDAIDLSGLLARAGYFGTDPVGAGYIKITADASGSAQIWSELAPISGAGWSLVTTLDGVSVASLSVQGEVVAGAPTVTPQVTVSDASYTAPAGVTGITLAGAWQTIHGNDAGDTFVVGNDTGNVLYGGAGDDTFYLGRNGDWVVGGGGSDTIVIQATQWTAGGVIDFGAGDKLDLSGLLANAGYGGSDPVGAGYLKLADDGAADAQVWLHQGSAWSLVTTLYGVPVSGLAIHGDIVAAAPIVTQVTVSDASYTAPAGGTSITLAGAWQTIHGNDAGDTFIVANNTGNVLYGGAGDDTFYLGRNGDWVVGGGGADTVVIQATQWTAGGVLDFGAGDKLDLSGLLASSGYGGSDPVGAGYLRITDDGAGDAQIWSRVGSTWSLATTLEHEAPSNLHVNGVFITG